MEPSPTPGHDRAGSSSEVVLLGGGCFWGVEHRLRQIDGVLATQVGYAGGHVDHPTYEQVCTGTTGHAEVVRVEFDPGVISLDGILDAFWSLHDPTQRDRQGVDVGPQYRSIILVADEEQEAAARASIARLDASRRLPRSVVTEVARAGGFWVAEEYHQCYLERQRVR